MYPYRILGLFSLKVFLYETRFFFVLFSSRCFPTYPTILNPFSCNSFMQKKKEKKKKKKHQNRKKFPPIPLPAASTILTFHHYHAQKKSTKQKQQLSLC